MDTTHITTVNAPPLSPSQDNCKPVATDTNDVTLGTMQHRVEGQHRLGVQEVEEEEGGGGPLQYIEIGPWY